MPSRTDHDQAFGELTARHHDPLEPKGKTNQFAACRFVPFDGLRRDHSRIRDGCLAIEPPQSVGRWSCRPSKTLPSGQRQRSPDATAQEDRPTQRGAGSPIAKSSTCTSSPKERDYPSILAVVDRLGRPVGSADLGRLRRRWLEYPPRESSGIITGIGWKKSCTSWLRMGCCEVVKTARGAVAYVPGENAEKYRRAGTAA